MSLLVCLKINQPKTLCVVCGCAHIMCLFSRRKATAEDISRPVHVGVTLRPMEIRTFLLKVNLR